MNGSDIKNVNAGEQVPPENPQTHAEAPASWTIRYRVRGFDNMLTLRAESGAALFPKIEQAIKWLEEHGARVTDEPPTSSTVKFLIKGYDTSVTMRGMLDEEFSSRLLDMIDDLEVMDAQPTRGYPSGAFGTPAGPTETKGLLADGSPDPAWCAEHQVTMRQYSNDKGSWYAHKIAGTDSWCNPGKKKK